MNNELNRIFFAFITLLSFCLNAFAQPRKIKSYELKGYIKELQSTSFLNDPDSVTTSNLIHNRINFRWNISSPLHTRIEIRNRVFYGEQVKLFQGFGKYIDTDDSYFKLSKLWVDESALVIHSIIDRALLTYSAAKVSITAGRQRINWGINTVWNPNDIFNAYNFLDFDYEERPGADALRMQYFLNSSSTLEAAFKPSEKTDETIAAMLFRTNKWKYDLQFLCGVYRGDVVIGGGWAGNINNAGFKGELSYFRDKNNFSDDNGELSLSATVDYSMKNSWYVSAAMLYQSKPASVEQGNSVFSGSGLSPKHLMPYRNTFFASVMKGFTPILSGNVAVIWSPENNSTIIFPTIAWSVSNSFDLDLTVQSFFAEVFDTYRTQGNSVYLRLRWSF